MKDENYAKIFVKQKYEKYAQGYVYDVFTRKHDTSVLRKKCKNTVENKRLSLKNTLLWHLILVYFIAGRQ